MKDGKAGIATIFDVAERAGVSYSTVSRVVNNYTFVKATTRARVLAAMEELGYIANLNARSLAGGAARVIGVLVFNLNTSYSVEIVRGIEEAVSTLDYDMILSTTHHRRRKEADHVAKLTRGLVDGLLIVLPSNLDAYVNTLESQGYPFVLVDHQGLQRAGSGSIQATNVQGGYDATRYLLELGHRRVGIITGPVSDPNAASCAADRLEGYRAALHDAGIAYDPDLVYEGDYLFDSGQEGTQRMLDLDVPPSAIFSSSDEAAFGVLEAAKRRGLDVPGALSVVGFDNIPQAAYGRLALTTIRQPLREMGRLATRMLINHLEGKEKALSRVELPTSLQIRDTTAPLRRV